MSMFNFLVVLGALQINVKHMNKHFLNGIDTVILRVSNIDKAKKWYSEKLRFNSIHEDEKLKLVVLDTFSPTSLTIWETANKIESNPRTTSYPVFRTLDAPNAHQQLKLNGVSVGTLISEHMVTYFTFQDLDGNILEVCQVSPEGPQMQTTYL